MGYTHFKHPDARKKNTTNKGPARHMIAYHGRGRCGIHKPNSHSNPDISMEIAKKSPTMPQTAPPTRRAQRTDGDILASKMSLGG